MAAGRIVELCPGDVKHAYRVLRRRKGDWLDIGDGEGTVYSGVVIAAGPGLIQVRLEQPVVLDDPPLFITLLQSLAKNEKMDLVVRQAVELGVSRIIPVITERSVPRWDGDKGRRRVIRWRTIARAASAQCRRSRIPEVKPPVDFLQALATLPAPRAGLTLVPWEGEKKLGLGELLRQPFPFPGGFLSLFIGPEGGFDESEINALSVTGARSVHLGPRILRTETASAVTLALVQAAWGDLGGGDRP